VVKREIGTGELFEVERDSLFLSCGGDEWVGGGEEYGGGAEVAQSEGAAENFNKELKWDWDGTDALWQSYANAIFSGSGDCV